HPPEAVSGSSPCPARTGPDARDDLAGPSRPRGPGCVAPVGGEGSRRCGQPRERHGASQGRARSFAGGKLNRGAFVTARRVTTMLAPHILVGPAILFVMVFLYAPVLFSVGLSLTDWNFINPEARFIGLA